MAQNTDNMGTLFNELFYTLFAHSIVWEESVTQTEQNRLSTRNMMISLQDIPEGIQRGEFRALLSLVDDDILITEGNLRIRAEIYGVNYEALIQKVIPYRPVLGDEDVFACTTNIKRFIDNTKFRKELAKQYYKTLEKPLYGNPAELANDVTHELQKAMPGRTLNIQVLDEIDAHKAFAEEQSALVRNNSMALPIPFISGTQYYLDVGDPMIIGAETGTGKTDWLLNVLQHFSEKKPLYVVGQFFETRLRQLQTRVYSRVLGLPRFVWKDEFTIAASPQEKFYESPIDPLDPKWAKLFDYYQRLVQWKKEQALGKFMMSSMVNATVEDMVTSIYYHAEQASNLGMPLVVGVDYLQLINNPGKFERDEMRIKDTSLRFRSAIAETNAFGIIASQLSGNSEAGYYPKGSQAAKEVLQNMIVLESTPWEKDSYMPEDVTDSNGTILYNALGYPRRWGSRRFQKELFSTVVKANEGDGVAKAGVAYYERMLASIYHKGQEPKNYDRVADLVLACARE